MMCFSFEEIHEVRIIKFDAVKLRYNMHQLYENGMKLRIKLEYDRDIYWRRPILLSLELHNNITGGLFDCPQV